MNSVPISVLLADEHKMYREALALTLSQDSRIQVVGQCGNGLEAEKLFSSLRPDIALIDITVHAARGFTTAGHILALFPDARIIGLSTFFTHAYALRIVASGGKGYLTKSMSYVHILEAIRRVFEGETYLCNELQQQD
jgi:two-component system, NarL family, response regulator DegU